MMDTRLTNIPASFEKLRDRPVFIGGHPKSGTSLVRALLDSHPQLVVYPEETIFFRRFLPMIENKPLEAQLALADQYLIHIFTWNIQAPPKSQAGFADRDYSDISFEGVAQALRGWIDRYGCRHPGDLLSAAVLAYGQVTGLPLEHIRLWVEKSPYNEFYCGQIFDWWPEARFLYVARDPRDNYVSYRRKHPSWSVEFFASNWNRSVQSALRSQGLLGKDRFRVIRYEDLVLHPRETMNAITSFLDIEANPSQKQPTRAGQSWQGNSMFGDQFQDISTTPLDRWKEILSRPETAIIEGIAHSGMEALNYPCSTKPGFVAAARIFSWPVRRRAAGILRRLSPKTGNQDAD